MFLDFAPELVVVEMVVVVVVIVGGAGGECVFGAVSGDDEERGYEGFLEVCEAETVRDGGDGGREGFGELDGGFVLQFLAPVIAV